MLLALAGLCHLIPLFFALVGHGRAVRCSCGPHGPALRALVTMVPVAGLLSAFWVVPFFLAAAT